VRFGPQGNTPDSRPWTVFISKLGSEDPDHAIDIVQLNNQAIATSGDYLQNWLVTHSDLSPKIYFHIFDPATLAPLEITGASIASVSVIANDCALADGLATAAMLFANTEAAEAWAKSIKLRYPEISFWIISRN